MTIEVDRSRIIAFNVVRGSVFWLITSIRKDSSARRRPCPSWRDQLSTLGQNSSSTMTLKLPVTAATNFLADAFKGKGVGFDGEEATDATLVYSAQEQVALAEGLIRAWGLSQLPQFLETFEVIEVEKEGRAILSYGVGNVGKDDPNYQVLWKGSNSDDLTLMFRPDALVRDKLSGDLYVVSWKTASMYGKRTLQQCRTDMQSISEVWGVHEQYNAYLSRYSVELNI